MKLSYRKKLKLVAYWNQGDWGVNQLATHFGVSEDALHKWLWRQHGFPGEIQKLRVGRPWPTQAETNLRSYVNAIPHS